MLSELGFRSMFNQRITVGGGGINACQIISINRYMDRTIIRSQDYLAIMIIWGGNRLIGKHFRTMANKESYDGDSFDEKYAWYRTETVKADRKLPLPREVQEALQNESRRLYEGDSPEIVWGYSKSADRIIISKHPLEKDDYESVAYSKIFKHDSKNTSIRPTKDLPERFLKKFYKGKRFVYLATTDMIDENPLSWVFDKREFQRMILPPESNDEIKDILKRNPGILPSF